VAYLVPEVRLALVGKLKHCSHYLNTRVVVHRNREAVGRLSDVYAHYTFIIIPVKHLHTFINDPYPGWLIF